MHRLPNTHSVNRFRFAAFLLLVKWLLVFASAGLLGYSLWAGNRQLTLLAMVLLGLAVLTMFLQWLVAARARCPLCIGHPLAHKACATHRHTRRFCGSYRVYVAICVIFRGCFRCPFCGEPTAVEVRQRRS